MTTMVDFYIELAAVPAPADLSKMSMPFPAALRRRLPPLPLVPIISIEMPIDPSTQYSNIAHTSGNALRLFYTRQAVALTSMQSTGLHILQRT